MHPGQPGAVDSNLDGGNDYGEEDAGEEDDDFLDEDEKFENCKRKLRLVLCQADFQNLPLLHPDNRLPETRYPLTASDIKSWLQTF